MIHRFFLTLLTIAQMTVMGSGVVFADEQWNLEDVERQKKSVMTGM